MQIDTLYNLRAELAQLIREQHVAGVVDITLVHEYGQVAFEIRQIENPVWLREIA